MKKNNAVIILNYNTTEETKRCIKELLKVKNIEIIIIDNNSKDEPLVLLKSLFPTIKTIQNETNVGFASGNNVGINYLLSQKIEKILLLNSDTKFTCRDISKLFQARGDIVGPVLFYRNNNRIIYDLGGHINQLLGRAVHEEVYSARDIGERFPDYVSGAAIMIKSSVFKKIGLFDEDYFLYYEDTDFCLRAKKEGFIIRIEPTIRIYHELSHSVGRGSPFGLYQNLRSNAIFIFKNIHGYLKPIAIIYWITLALKVLIKYSLSMIKLI